MNPLRSLVLSATRNKGIPDDEMPKGAQLKDQQSFWIHYLQQELKELQMTEAVKANFCTNLSHGSG